MVALLSAFSSHPAQSQDRRVVREPVIPNACAVLSSNLKAVENSTSLAESDERKLDTARIQSAIEACAPGDAVELKASAKGNAFLSGPLELRAGVTLVVDANAILFGSRCGQCRSDGRRNH